jgi:hypothetical protein
MGGGIHGDQAAVEICDVDEAAPGIWYRRRDDLCPGRRQPSSVAPVPAETACRTPSSVPQIDRVAIHSGAGGGAVDAILPTLEQRRPRCAA